MHKKIFVLIDFYFQGQLNEGVFGSVIKPGPARRVDPGPGRPGGRTGPGLLKDRLGQQPGQTRTRPDVFFFFKYEI